MGRIWKVLTRKKVINPVTAEETRLGRVLTVFDLTALGVGSTLGVGLFILAGQVAKDTAGPSVILSFVLAAIASAFAGLCYAEFGARVPRAGSAYIYSYVCVGEFIAFVIGWNLILEYIIGSASVARGISVYIDSLLNNTMENAFKEIAPINVRYLSTYFDFFSFSLSVLVSVCLAFGLKESSMVNNIVTILNILVVVFIVVAGSLKADLANWQVPENISNITNSTNIGNGGFFPFGVEGMIKGAATCFYAFVGFDCIATTGEEVNNPRKAIPVSILTSLLIVFLAYFGVSTVLTLMVPYYLQDHDAPILKAFEAVGFNVAKWIIAIGAIFGLSASLFGAIFPLPRIIYAMGSDGLIFKFLAKVSPRFQSPVIGTIFAGLLTGLMSAVFDIGQLINMMSIGTLQAYTMVAASVLILRYKDETKKVYIPIKTSSDTESLSSESSVDEKYNDNGMGQNFNGLTNDDQELISSTTSPGFSTYLKKTFNCSNSEPNRITENIVAFEVLIYCIFCIGISLCIIHLKTNILNGEPLAIIITSLVAGLTVLLVISLATQPKSRRDLSFKVPLVPLIPALSIIINIYLMLMLDTMTWVRFGVWMAFGIPMYCACACTRSLPQKLQNGHYQNNLTNGTSKDISGRISIPSFGIKGPNGHPPKSYKKKPSPAPPPTIFETMEVQQDAAIAQLDEILDNEAAILQLEDTSNNEIVRVRKLSIDSLSNMSTTEMGCEDVECADVHCANVFTPVASPVCFNIVKPDEIFQPKNVELVSSKLVQSVNQYDEFLPEEKDQITILNSNIEHIDGKLSSTREKRFESYPVVENLIEDSKLSAREISSTASYAIKHKESVITSGNSDSVITINNDLKAEYCNNTLQPDLLKTELYDSDPKGYNSSLSLEDASLISSKKDSKPDDSNQSFVANSELDQSSDFKPFFTISPLKTLETTVPSALPTKDTLKTVTLRHVERKHKNIDTTNDENAPGHNLRVGSEEYKKFIQNLDGKLKRFQVLPAFYGPPKKYTNESREAVQVKLTENIIYDHIDQAEAKEKLKQFLTKNSDERVGRKLQESLSVVEYIGPNKFINKNSLEEDSELENHRKKMENVFKSIKLKRLTPKGGDYLKRRLSKSLGSNFAKGYAQADHKIKMDDIFKDIKAVRKNSIK